MSFNFRSIKTRAQRIRQRQELIPYILDYLKTHNYIKSKTIANIYFQKNNIKNYNDLERDKILKIITYKISGYFGALTREGYIKPFSNGRNKMYKKTDNMIEGFKDLLKGKKMMKSWCGHIPTSTDTTPRLEWREFEDLENNEDNLYFLGSLKEVDSNFRHLYEQIIEELI